MSTVDKCLIFCDKIGGIFAVGVKWHVVCAVCIVAMT